MVEGPPAKDGGGTIVAMDAASADAPISFRFDVVAAGAAPALENSQEGRRRHLVSPLVGTHTWLANVAAATAGAATILAAGTSATICANSCEGSPDSNPGTLGN